MQSKQRQTKFLITQTTLSHVNAVTPIYDEQVNCHLTKFLGQRTSTDFRGT